MILNSLFKIILDFVVAIVQILLLPIDLLIDSFLPDLSNIIATINSFINFIVNNINFAMDLTLLPNWVIVFVCDVLIFKVSATFITYVVKIAIKWYDSLKG